MVVYFWEGVYVQHAMSSLERYNRSCNSVCSTSIITQAYHLKLVQVTGHVGSWVLNCPNLPNATGGENRQGCLFRRRPCQEQGEERKVLNVLSRKSCQGRIQPMSRQRAGRPAVAAGSCSALSAQVQAGGGGCVLSNAWAGSVLQVSSPVFLLKRFVACPPTCPSGAFKKAVWEVEYSVYKVCPTEPGTLSGMSMPLPSSSSAWEVLGSSCLSSHSEGHGVTA